jgi:hypothetical protein
MLVMRLLINVFIQPAFEHIQCVPVHGGYKMDETGFWSSKTCHLTGLKRRASYPTLWVRGFGEPPRGGAV